MLKEYLPTVEAALSEKRVADVELAMRLDAVAKLTGKASRLVLADP